MTSNLLQNALTTPDLADVCSVVSTHALRCDRESTFPSEAMAALRTSGLLGLLVPREHGGTGGGWSDLVNVTRRLATADLSVALIFAMHCQQVGTIASHSTDAWAEQLLKRIADGNCLLASVTTDAQTGSDPLRPGSSLTRAGGRVHLDRVAPVVTAGLQADGFLITAHDPQMAHADSTSMLFADRSQVTVEQQGTWEAMGMRATQSIALRLTCDLPERQIVGQPGRFRDVALQTFMPLAHIGWAAAWLGAAAGALGRTVTHLRLEGRKRKTLPPDLVLHRLACARSNVDTVHAVLRHTVAVAHDSPIASPSVQLALNNLKVVAAELTLSAVDTLIDLAGLRHGYLSNSPLGLERVHRDLRSATLTVSNDKIKLASGRLALLDVESNLA